MLIKPALILLSYSLIISEETRGFNTVVKFFDQCSRKNDIFKCLKINVIKIANRALHLKNVTIIDGVSLVSDGREPKSMRFGLNLNDSELEKLDSEQLEGLLAETTSKFLETHELAIKVPNLVEEGRRAKRKGGGGGGGAALYWALAIKGAFLAMAYNGIAVMSGMALIMGKMALLLSAILGLKKLVSSGQETTTLEIIKKPKYSESHSYSSSHEDEDHHKPYDRGDVSVSKKILRTYFH